MSYGRSAEQSVLALVCGIRGGGGYGGPLERAPERIQADVLDRKVSPEAAASVYGVILRDGALDEAATGDARRCLRAEAAGGERGPGGDAPTG